VNRKRYDRTGYLVTGDGDAIGRRTAGLAHIQLVRAAARVHGQGALEPGEASRAGGRVGGDVDGVVSGAGVDGGGRPGQGALDIHAGGTRRGGGDGNAAAEGAAGGGIVDGEGN